jgi:hypothetical protein
LPEDPLEKENTPRSVSNDKKGEERFMSRSAGSLSFHFKRENLKSQK